MLLGAGATCMAEFASVTAVSRRLSSIAGGCRKIWRNTLYTLTAEDEACLAGFWSDVLSNAWVTPIIYEEAERQPLYIVATDAQGVRNARGEDCRPGETPVLPGRWGWVILDERHAATETDFSAISGGGEFIGGLGFANIFLQELAVAIWAIRSAIRQGKQHIVIVVDNTGAAAVLRRLYSHNAVATGWLAALGSLLREKRVYLRVISVPGKKNVADAPSRGRRITLLEYLTTLEVVEAELEGRRIGIPATWKEKGIVRDFDPEDADDVSDLIQNVSNDEPGATPLDDSAILGDSVILRDEMFRGDAL